MTQPKPTTSAPRPPTSRAVAAAVPARGQHVVDDQHPLRRAPARPGGSRGVGAVLERRTSRLSTCQGSLPALRTGTKPAPELDGDGRGDDEAPGLDADAPCRSAGSAKAPASALDAPAQGGSAGQQRGDVLEDHAGLREVGDVPDEILQPAGRALHVSTVLGSRPGARLIGAPTRHRAGRAQRRRPFLRGAAAAGCPPAAGLSRRPLAGGGGDVGSSWAPCADVGGASSDGVTVSPGSAPSATVRPSTAVRSLVLGRRACRLPALRRHRRQARCRAAGTRPGAAAARAGRAPARRPRPRGPDAGRRPADGHRRPLRSPVAAARRSDPPRLPAASRQAPADLGVAGLAFLQQRQERARR